MPAMFLRCVLHKDLAHLLKRHAAMSVVGGGLGVGARVHVNVCHCVHMRVIVV